MKALYLLALFAILSVLTYSYEDCTGTTNTLPLINQEPILLESVKNGKKYLIQNGTNLVYIVSVRGNAYQQGYAFGKLMSKEVKENLLGFYDYLKAQADQKLAEYKLPKFIRKMLVGTAFEVFRGILDLNYLITMPFTPIRYGLEMKGIAKGSGMDYKDIRRLNLFPELIKAACSIVGAWGNASKNGNLVELRALDWDRNAPMTQYPAITVYHSTEPGSVPYANIGYAGLIGSLTGFSNASIGIVQKVWMPSKERGIETSRIGKPWHYVLRDLLQFSTDLDSAMD